MSPPSSAAKPRPWFFQKLIAPAETAFIAPALVAWRRTLMVLVVIGLVDSLLHLHRGIADYFFSRQDLPVALAMLLLMSGLYLVRPPRALPSLAGWNWRAAALMGAAAVAVGWIGAHAVYDGYALSMDEFMAVFDTQIFKAGRLAAEVPQAWRHFVPALEPRFGLAVPGNAYWVSSYLPVNAAFRALAARVGADYLINPLWAGVSVLAVYGIARRLWPERPTAALVAAALLATSPQVLIAAMTPYAMPAHLALNLVWLWLVLRGGRLGHGAAAGVAFLATGLHQLVFHPLFAGPFVLELWLARRWKPALFHTCAYAVIGAFWAAYPALVLHTLGAGAASAAAAGSTGLLPRLVSAVTGNEPMAVVLMAKNLVRFVTWQSLLAVPLALVVARTALRTPGPLRALVVGLAATTLAVMVLMAFQGHGWGYRYLHGLIGSVCLLAAFGWMRLTEGAQGQPARAQSAVFATALAASLLILLPWRAWQVHSFVHPYATAERAVQAMDADIVLIDDAPVVYGVDLVRNDPLWTHRPIVLALSALTPADLAEVCRRG
ncbi:hypothetical protein, partial [Phenylobacterium sp.]|uniref:hypothetical protein n=1 Tax=Phenylobacterium sp. TaxID=1871053 RepID=UPI002E35C642